MQHDEAPWRAPEGGTTTAPGRTVEVGRQDAGAVTDLAAPQAAPPDADGGEPVGPSVVSTLTALPRTRRRPLTRRAHARIPDATAAVVERLSWGEVGREVPTAAAVSVVPGAGLPATFRRRLPGADLDDLIGPVESGVAPGRHRGPHPAWQVLRRLPGWRPTPGAREDDPLSPTAGPDITEPDVTGPDVTEPDVTGPDVTEPDVPVYRRRRRRSPAPATRSALQAAGARIETVHGRAEIARAVAEESAALVDADVVALVLRAVEGPRVVWIHPGGPDGAGLWGPATLGSLLRAGHPVRRVVDGDPLAGGRPTALLSVPVPVGGSVAGSLMARRDEPRAFTATEQDVLARLARMAGAALLAAARPSPRGRSDVDAATGLPGPGRFAAEVEAAVRAAERRGIPVAVLALHVEGLGRLRTELGEVTANETLRALVTALGAVLRVGDLAYRIGADELALLLPATDATGLPSIRERLEAVTAETVAALEVPGARRSLGLRSAGVPLDGIRAGHHVIDVANRVLALDRQKVRWTTG